MRMSALIHPQLEVAGVYRENHAALHLLGLLLARTVDPLENVALELCIRTSRLCFAS